MSTSLNLSTNSLKGKVLLNSKFSFENQMWLIKRYARKSIYHGCIVWIEKSVTFNLFQHLKHAPKTEIKFNKSAAGIA